MIPGYEDGANITIMNALYKRMEKNESTGKWEDDYLTLVYKDNTTGKKDTVTIPCPDYEYYILKPELQVPDYNLHFMEIENLDVVKCKYKDIKKSIAEQTGNMDLFKENIKYGNPRANDLFLAHPRVFSADMNILNFARAKFNEKYQNPVCPITIAFFDIESDIIDADTDDIVLGRDPVNMISMYYTGTNTMYTFILRNDRNPQIAELEAKMKKNFKEYKKKFTDFILYDLGSEEKVAKYGLTDIKLSVGFYSTEAEMICTFFDCINTLQPDFATAYNMAYDIPQLLARLEANNIDPKDVLCDLKYFDGNRLLCEYYAEADKPNPEERCDRFDVSSLTTFLDQMIIYASRRKGQAAVESYKLDDIGRLECGVRKLDYHDLTTNIAKFPYLDFERFWLYNMIDVIVQVCLEAQTADIKYVFNNAIEMNTPYQKIFRQTVYLAAKAADFYKNTEGVILGNNVNKFGQKPDKKFPGAFVANPKLLTNRNKLVARGGKIINKFNNGNDFDYKRLYPSLLQYFNMAPHTQVGMVTIDNTPFKDDDKLMLEPGGTFIENLGSYNFIDFCHRWMNMGNIEECMEDIKEYFSTYRTPIYKGEGNLEYDVHRKHVLYFEYKNNPVSFDIPLPEWVKQETDKIRNKIFKNNY